MCMTKWMFLDGFDLCKQHVTRPKSARRGEVVHDVWALDSLCGRQRVLERGPVL